jgi:uncharacterized membrane protein YfcA
VDAILPLLHPALGSLAVAAVLYAGLHGLRSRRREPAAARRREAHRRVAPLALLLVAASLVGGLASVRLLRDDLTAAASAHFYVASAVLFVMVLLRATSPTGPRALPRPKHAALGFATMLAAALTAVLGLGLLP